MMEIVAEVGPCNGRMDDAMAYVDACAELGITMKVQWYDRDRLTTRTAPRYDHTDGREITQYTMFEKTLTWDQWKEVFAYAKSVNVPIFPTVFDIESVMVAEAMEIKRLKIASADITYHDLIAAAARASEELIISTGGATSQEVGEALQVTHDDKKLTLLACHLGYPSRLSEANLGRMVALKDSFGPFRFDVGYSDHVKGQVTSHLPMLVALGCSMWERHFTLTPGRGGDHNMAIDFEGMKGAIGIIRAAMATMGDYILRPTAEEQEALRYARRSLVAAEDIKRGERVTRDRLKVVRPGTGIPPSQIDNVTAKGGMIAMEDIGEDTVLQWPMIGFVGASLNVE